MNLEIKEIINVQHNICKIIKNMIVMIWTFEEDEK